MCWQLERIYLCRCIEYEHRKCFRTDPQSWYPCGNTPYDGNNKETINNHCEPCRILDPDLSLRPAKYNPKNCTWERTRFVTHRCVPYAEADPSFSNGDPAQVREEDREVILGPPANHRHSPSDRSFTYGSLYIRIQTGPHDVSLEERYERRRSVCATPGSRPSTSRAVEQFDLDDGDPEQMTTAPRYIEPESADVAPPRTPEKTKRSPLRRLSLTLSRISPSSKSPPDTAKPGEPPAGRVKVCYYICPKPDTAEATPNTPRLGRLLPQEKETFGEWVLYRERYE